ncbi:hypothetical protein GCM10025881_25110 [Pseudolysinimonas kribbensis]|uniref:DNA ligase D polymerase domain-containing protein n=1 Tax=Pseudolysinimonas kribbensis TaxID=433641 RepID=A0ABQ6KA58_9MICO|nr:hypothetical protein GCM10025881_25110 [Pseudolysinimonas kribbensis]
MADAVTLDVEGPDGPRSMRVSSPDRVLWPDAGVTKRELVEYLVAVGDAFVEANGDRPVALQRFPAGIEGEEFFSKAPPKGTPDFIRTTMVTFPSARAHPMLVIDEPAAAVWMAQMNTIVFHPGPPAPRTSIIPISSAWTSTRSRASASPMRCARRPC